MVNLVVNLCPSGVIADAHISVRMTVSHAPLITVGRAHLQGGCLGQVKYYRTAGEVSPAVQPKRHSNPGELQPEGLGRCRRKRMSTVLY